MSRPAAEVEVDADVVRRLLESDFPPLAGAPLRRIGEGWDNVTFLADSAHAVRLPRREAAVALLLNEQRWLPTLAPRLRLEVPEPVHAGVPGPWFAWPWSVVRWVPGDTAEGHCFGAEQTETLAATLLELHLPAPEGAPRNPLRGVPLETRDEVVGERLDRLSGHPRLDTSRLAAMWRSVVVATPTATERRWLHGDLHPRNVVIRDGALAGLIDWGDLNGGDVATDLACAWMLIDTASQRSRFWEAYEANDELKARALGWALHMGLGLVDSGEPEHVPLGLATLERVVTDPLLRL